MKANKILVFSDWYLPGFIAGGPIRSVSNLVELLKRDREFAVLTSDTDFGRLEPYPGITSNQWLEGDCFRILYLGRGIKSWLIMIRSIRKAEADTCYFNSMFSVRFTIFPLLYLRLFHRGKQLIVAPRGMLGEGPLGLKKRKKAVFLRWSKRIGLFRSVRWHATSDTEKKDIQRCFGENTKVMVIPNIPSLPSAVKREREKQANHARFVFCARIAPIKNVKKAIEWMILAAERCQGNIEFTLFGPIEDREYWNSCLELIEGHKCHNLKIRYRGEIQPDMISGEYHLHDFFFLPTFHESYGHAIVEALASGLPALISDQTPWRKLEDQNAGWDIDLKQDDKFTEAICSCVEMTPETYRRMSENTIAYINEQVKLNELKMLYLTLFDPKTT